MAISATQSNQNFFQESFSTLQDPRRTTKENIIYSLEEILFLTISAVICGCNTWAFIAEYGRLKKVENPRKLTPTPQRNLPPPAISNCPPDTCSNCPPCKAG